MCPPVYGKPVDMRGGVDRFQPAVVGPNGMRRVVIAENKTRISWNHAHRLAKGVDDAHVTEEFQAAVLSGGVQWS